MFQANTLVRRIGPLAALLAIALSPLSPAFAQGQSRCQKKYPKCTKDNLKRSLAGCSRGRESATTWDAARPSPTGNPQGDAAAASGHASRTKQLADAGASACDEARKEIDETCGELTKDPTCYYESKDARSEASKNAADMRTMSSGQDVFARGTASQASDISASGTDSARKPR